MESLRVETTPHGHRLVACAPVAPGQRLVRIEGHLRGSASRHSLQVGAHTHLVAPDDADPLRTHPWIAADHSCVPTAAVRGRALVALVALQPGDTVTFDYETTEFEMAEPFECRCGHDACRGTIRGFRHLDPATRRRLRPLLAPHLAALAGDP